jgi:dCMP deaminase
MRPTADAIFMVMAQTISLRATCNRLRVGAVLTLDNAILTTGYNGAPKGMPHCLDVECLMVDNHCKRTVHAERNAIIWAAKRGPTISGSTLYLTHSPCFDCLTLMVQVGVKRIVFHEWYPRIDDRVIAMCQHNGIILQQFTNDKTGPVPVPQLAPPLISNLLFNGYYRVAEGP